MHQSEQNLHTLVDEMDIQNVSLSSTQCHNCTVKLKELTREYNVEKSAVQKTAENTKMNLAKQNHMSTHFLTIQPWKYT